MLLLLAAAFADFTLERPADFWSSPADRAAYTAQLVATARSTAELRAGAPCPATATLAGESFTPAGLAEAILGAQAGDEVDPSEIVYRERVKVEGCGPATRYDNVFAARKKAGGWMMVASAPGRTAASPRLVLDVLRLARGLAEAAEPGCAPGGYRLTDTEILDGGPRQWRETWTQSVCGKDHSAIVTFTPIPGAGVTFDVKPAAAGPA